MSTALSSKFKKTPARHTGESLEELRKALETVSFGSVEIYVQDGVITQITIRHIKKTNLEINGSFKKILTESPI